MGPLRYEDSELAFLLHEASVPSAAWAAKLVRSFSLVLPTKESPPVASVRAD
jgi:hypothetical protein